MKKLWIVEVGVWVPYANNWGLQDPEGAVEYRRFLVKAASRKKAWKQIFLDWGNYQQKEVLTNAYGERFCAHVIPEELVEISPANTSGITGWEWGLSAHPKYDRDRNRSRYKVKRYPEGYLSFTPQVAEGD